MSFTYSAGGVMPIPQLAWDFQSSNVDYVSGLSPSSQVSPGPAQLVGSAALVTNAPTSNTAVYFPGTTSTWMNLGTSTPVNFDTSLSNIFMECWVYSSRAYNPNFITWHQGALGGQENWSMYFGTDGSLITSIWGDVAGTATQGGTGVGSAISQNTWTHVGFAIANTASVYKTYIYVNGTPTAYTPPAGWVPKFYASGITQIGGRNYSPDLTNMYIRDLRVVQGGVVPTTSFTPGSAPFSYTLPSYVTGSGSVVFTLLGQFVTYVPGKYNQALMIQNPDAVNQLNTYLSYPLTNSISVDSGVTISCWVQIRKTPSSSERCVYTFNRGSNNPGLYLAYNASNNFYVVLNNGTNVYIPSFPTISLNTWYNAIVVINNGTVSYYVNGTSYNAATYTPPSGVTLQTNFILGGTTNSAYQGNFIIDDLRIYNTALTSTQVQSIYNQHGVPGRAVQTRVAQPLLIGNATILYGGAPTSNTAVYFPGTVSDYMNLGTSTSTNFDASTSNVFFEAWINWTNLTGQQRVYGRYLNPQATSSLNLYMRKLSDNTLQISGGSGNSASNSTALSTGVWYHIAFSSIPGGSSYVFVNGVPGTGTALTYTAHNAAYNTYIGSGASQYLSGYIRDLRVVQGGVVPTTSFTPQAATWAYGSVPSYVTGGTNVLGLAAQYMTPTPLTGTPLFTQLSTSVTSSAVGAFSLRAVNGGTAKAVAVQVHPVVAYPSASLTSNTTTLNAQTYGNGPYTTVASSYNAGGGIYEAWRAFTNVTNWWRPATASYNGTTGIYVGTTYSTVSGGVSYYGEWLQIQLPNKIRLVNYTLDQAPVLAGGQLNSTPLTFYVFGSSDLGTTWTLIDAQDVPVYTTQTFVVPSANAITTYDWFRLSVNKIPPLSTVLRIAKWILNGSADNYATGSATDFYADRLGNLLTAPVTGQTLARWLAGGSGYVTTWYDQSGAGNHATQATAANQPIITRATKGPGYACYFTGNPTQMSFNTPTGNIFDNTDFTISAVTRRTIDISGFQFFVGTSPASSGVPSLKFGYTSSTLVRLQFNNISVDSVNVSVSAYSGASEPTGYNIGMFSQTSGMISYAWRNGTQTSATAPLGITPGTTSGTGTLGCSRNQQYFTGEMYEVLVFTKSLYDLDGTSTITQIYQNQLGIYGT